MAHPLIRLLASARIHLLPGGAKNKHVVAALYPATAVTSASATGAIKIASNA